MSVLNVAIVGCGLIAQIMHLPHIRDLREHFKLRALCDTSPQVLAAVAADYQVERNYADYRKLLACENIDVVLILTSGNHTPIVLAALEAGKHVFVEKPLCFSLSDADRMIEASLRRNLCLMVGYMKWFDPSYQAAQKILRLDNSSPKLLQITTILPPEDYYYRHHRLHLHPPDFAALEQARIERGQILSAELPDIPLEARDVYADMLLDNAIHDLYVLRGLVGDPKDSGRSSFWANGKALHLSWQYSNDLEVHQTLVQLGHPSSRYQETVNYYSAAQRLTLDFPSPYLRNAPTEFVVEEIVGGDIMRLQRDGSFEESFKQELLHFHQCVQDGSTPLSSGLEGRKDIAMMQTAIRACVR